MKFSAKPMCFWGWIIPSQLTLRITSIVQDMGDLLPGFENRFVQTLISIQSG